jgi:RNA polymerase sigma-70 factor (ECF subfamily)
MEATLQVEEHAGTTPAPRSADHDLARLAASGDLVATQRLLASVTPRMIRVVRAVLGSTHADADDVVQQALIGFVQALPSFRGDCEPVHFASRIAVRSAVAAARRTTRARGRRDDGVDLDTIVSTSVLPADLTAEQRRLKEVLRALLARIPAEQAEAIALRFVLGWSLEEVARVTEAPVNTVRSRVRLAKRALRAAIESDPVLAEELGRDA